MSSNIVPGNVDGTFPVAGQDNSSQGFRDNFTAIKNNFTEAKTEIEDLQDNKASTNQATSFNDNTVTRAYFKDTSYEYYSHGNKIGEIVLNYENGHYHRVTGTTGNTTLSFSNLPNPGVGRLILDITFSDTDHMMYITENTLVASNVQGFDATTNAVTVPAAGRYVYEFVSLDADTQMLMHQLGGLYTTTPTP